MAHEIAGISTCRFCGRKFVGPTGAGLLLGQAPGAARFLLEITEHIQNDHKREDAALVFRATEFLGFLRLRNYLTSDTAVLEQLDGLRWQVHQETLAAQIRDEAMQQQAHTIAEKLSSEISETIGRQFFNDEAAAPIPLVDLLAAKLLELMTGFREVYQEPNKYPRTAPVTGQITH